MPSSPKARETIGGGEKRRKLKKTKKEEGDEVATFIVFSSLIDIFFFL